MSNLDSRSQQILANIFIWTNRRVRQLTSAIEALHFGIWLGILDRSGLHRVTELNYCSTNFYLNKEYNRSGLCEWEKSAVDDFFSTCGSILVGAAGGGREVLALAQRGYRVDAFEPSAEFANSCRELLKSEGISAEIIESLPDQVPVSFGIYDGLLLGWGAYNHVPGRRARIDLLRQFRRHTRSGGPMLLSFYTRGEQARQLRWIYRIARLVGRLCFRRELAEFGDSFSGFFAHHFTEEEIRSEFEEASFRVVYYSEKSYGQAVGIAE
jgi:hypothetical protein